MAAVVHTRWTWATGAQSKSPFYAESRRGDPDSGMYPPLIGPRTSRGRMGHLAERSAGCQGIVGPGPCPLQNEWGMQWINGLPNHSISYRVRAFFTTARDLTSAEGRDEPVTSVSSCHADSLAKLRAPCSPRAVERQPQAPGWKRRQGWSEAKKTVCTAAELDENGGSAVTGRTESRI